MADRAIHIRASGEVFDVIFEPAAEWADLDRTGLPSHRAASRAAWALKVVHGWPIRDDAQPKGGRA